jgi:hypothetical protein
MFSSRVALLSRSLRTPPTVAASLNQVIATRTFSDKKGKGKAAAAAAAPAPAATIDAAQHRPLRDYWTKLKRNCNPWVKPRHRVPNLLTFYSIH